MNKEKEYLPTRFSLYRVSLLAFFVILIFFLENPYTVSFLGSKVFTYILKPLLWLGVAGVVWSFRSVRPKGKMKLKGFIYLWSFNFTIIFIVIQFLAGLMEGFGKSPVDHSWGGIGINIIYITSLLIGRELVRNYLVNSCRHEESYIIFIFIALLMSITAFPLSKYTGFKDSQEIVKFIAQFLGPEFSKNLLATYLAYLGGPFASIIFMGGLEAFNWFSPILPNLKWITSALVGILVPIFLFMIMQSLFANESKSKGRKAEHEEGPAGWIFTTLLSILIIWFSVGVFPIYPSVIATGSMKPMIHPGDVILVDKSITIGDLNIGDVIQFKRNSILISHRILEIVKDKGGQVSLRTKGDDNSVEDAQLVKPEDVKGKVIKVIPKVGWPTLLLKSNQDALLNEVEF